MATTSRQAGLTSASGSRSPDPSVLVESTMAGTHLFLAVVGEADHHSAPTLRDDLLVALDRRPSSVVVDVSRLAYCDLAGLDALDDFCAAATGLGVPADVRGMSPLLAWLRATFPPAHGGSSQPDRSRSDAGRYMPSGPGWAGGAPLGAVAAARPPRPWPVR